VTNLQNLKGGPLQINPLKTLEVPIHTKALYRMSKPLLGTIIANEVTGIVKSEIKSCHISSELTMIV